jgi:peptide deformylase
MLLKIVQAGEPVLRRATRELVPAEIRSRNVQVLIELMRETMRDAPGVGLAAPQIGEALRLAVIEDRADYVEGLGDEERAARQRREIPFHVIVNPRLTVVDATPVEFFEGCLSVAGLTALVPRASAVRVEALDEKASPVTIEASGWYARILQHEIDHLDGNLYLDRMHTRSLCTQENHARFWSGRPVDEVKRLLGIAAGADVDRK